MNSKLKAYITGGTGFIGYNIARVLVMQGWDLYALYRKGANIEKLENLGVKLVCGDLRNKESILEGMPFNVDAVFHTGGNVSFHKNSNIEQDQDNIHGTMNMVSASIQKSSKRFIYTSTAASYGIHKGWVTEETKSNALTIPINYFKSKKIAEDIVIDAYKARDFDAVILNPANVVGPYDTKIWGPFAIKLAKGELKSIGSGTGSFCHAESVANSHIKAYHNGQSGHRYLLAGTIASFSEVSKIIAKLTYSNDPTIITGPIKGISEELSQLMNYDQHICCDKAIRELNFKVSSLNHMFGDLINWLNESGQIK